MSQLARKHVLDCGCGQRREGGNQNAIHQSNGSDARKVIGGDELVGNHDEHSGQRDVEALRHRFFLHPEDSPRQDYHQCQRHDQLQDIKAGPTLHFDFHQKLRKWHIVAFFLQLFDARRDTDCVPFWNLEIGAEADAVYFLVEDQEVFVPGEGLDFDFELLGVKRKLAQVVMRFELSPKAFFIFDGAVGKDDEFYIFKFAPAA